MSVDVQPTVLRVRDHSSRLLKLALGVTGGHDLKASTRSRVVMEFPSSLQVAAAAVVALLAWVTIKIWGQIIPDIHVTTEGTKPYLGLNVQK